MILTASADDGAIVVTDLGSDHQLVYNRYGFKDVGLSLMAVLGRSLLLLCMFWEIDTCDGLFQ